MLGAIAQFERELMLERQREGVAKAKLEGKYKGRAPTARAKERFAGFTVKASARLKLQSGYELAGRVFIACLARVECLCIAVIADHTNRQSETPTEKAGVSLIQICGQLIPVVIPPRPVIVPGTTRIVAMTPGPVVFVIVVAMT